MVKSKKKRTKKYRGPDAASDRPQIIRVQAANRSKFGQWLFENKRLLKFVGVVAAIVLAILLVVSGLVSLFSS